MLGLYTKHVNLKVAIREVRKRGSFCKHERGGSHFNIYVGEILRWGQFLEYGMTCYLPFFFFFFLTDDETYQRYSSLET